MNEPAAPIKVSPRVPVTRDECVGLLQRCGWNLDELSPEETARIRHLYNLDTDQPVAESVMVAVPGTDGLQDLISLIRKRRCRHWRDLAEIRGRLMGVKDPETRALIAREIEEHGLNRELVEILLQDLAGESGKDAEGGKR